MLIVESNNGDNECAYLGLVSRSCFQLAVISIFRQCTLTWLGSTIDCGVIAPSYNANLGLST